MPVSLQIIPLIVMGGLLMACSEGSPLRPDGASGTPSGQSQARTPKDLAFQATRGERFSVVLPSAGAGGYQWHLVEAHDPAVVRLERQRVGPLPPDPMPGRFADEIFEFVAVGSGRTTLQFVQYREWEGPERAVETRRHAVTVR